MEDTAQKLEIPNHAGYYADTDGNIYNKKGHRLVPQKAGSYVCVDLPIGNGKFKKFTIHRLVATTFIKNDDNKPQVNHKDGNKHNNSVANLEWNTRSENQKHRFHKLLHSHFGEKNTQAKLSKQNVIEIVKMRTSGIDLDSISSIFQVSKPTICDIMSGRSWSHITGLPPKRNIKRMEALGYAI